MSVFRVLYLVLMIPAKNIAAKYLCAASFSNYSLFYLYSSTTRLSISKPCYVFTSFTDYRWCPGFPPAPFKIISLCLLAIHLKSYYIYKLYLLILKKNHLYQLRDYFFLWDGQISYIVVITVNTSDINPIKKH